MRFKELFNESINDKFLFKADIVNLNVTGEI